MCSVKGNCGCTGNCREPQNPTLSSDRAYCGHEWSFESCGYCACFDKQRWRDSAFFELCVIPLGVTVAWIAIVAGVIELVRLLT